MFFTQSSWTCWWTRNDEQSVEQIFSIVQWPAFRVCMTAATKDPNMKFQIYGSPVCTAYHNVLIAACKFCENHKRIQSVRSFWLNNYYKVCYWTESIPWDVSRCEMKIVVKYHFCFGTEINCIQCSLFRSDALSLNYRSVSQTIVHT